MFTVRYGGKNGQKVTLKVSREYLSVRSRSRGAIAAPPHQGGVPLSVAARSILAEFEVKLRLPEVGVEVLGPAESGARAIALRDRARKLLTREPAIEFA